MTRESTSKPREPVVHLDYGDRPFCHARGKNLKLHHNEDHVTCKRCLRKFDVQDSPNAYRD